MNRDVLKQRLEEIREEELPLPGGGHTADRHRRLMAIGREDLSLAKLAEAHWDAVAILADAGRPAKRGALYAVWASDMPTQPLRVERAETGYRVSGTKMFCSGAGLVDRALITTGGDEAGLMEIDLAGQPAAVEIDLSAWKTDAFQMTNTGAVRFREFEVAGDAVVGDRRWYLDRPGFWHGGCGPAACWAGGVAGLLDFAMHSKRDDAHTLAHIAAMHANGWAMECYLDAAGQEIDRVPEDYAAAKIRALQVRHLVEQASSDSLQRFARAFGPYPLSMDAELSRRYQEIGLYLRQSHGERDLETLAHCLKRPEVCSEGA